MARRYGRAFARLALLLAVGLLVPGASLRTAPAVLVGIDVARGVDHPAGVVWILALGSDARPGEPVLRSRADAIQLVGVDLDAGRAVALGIPRDSWVPIPGHGSNRINAALTYGGPELMGRTVADLVGVQPDYVFVASFTGFRAMVQAIGGVTVRSRLAFTDDHMPGSIRQGRNRLNGFESLFFSRARHLLPRGDFDRSANQQEMLRAILREVRAHQDRPGFMERAMFSVGRNLNTTLSPVELYRLAQALTAVDPTTMPTCVLGGSFGTVNGASIVFPDVAAARAFGQDTRADARLDRPC